MSGFEYIGIGCTTLFCLFVITIAIDYIIGKIKKLMYAYKVKHRFDKEPKAKCYCKDCEWWECNHCDNWYGHMNDNDFCSRATPRTYETGIE